MTIEVDSMRNPIDYVDPGETIFKFTDLMAVEERSMTEPLTHGMMEMNCTVQVTFQFSM